MEHRYLFERAEKLGMTVATLLAGSPQPLDSEELLEWMALDALRNYERETAVRQAGKGMRPRR